LDPWGFCRALKLAPSWNTSMAAAAAVLMCGPHGDDPSEERPVITGSERPVKLMAAAAYAAEVFPVIL